MSTAAVPTRYQCSELVTIMSSPNRRGRPMTGNLEEIATSSAVVLTERPLRSGTKVRIISAKKHLDGIIQDCTLDEALGFFLHVQLAPWSQWSPAEFLPKHFLDLCSERLAKVFTLPNLSGPLEKTAGNSYETSGPRARPSFVASGHNLGRNGALEIRHHP